MRAKSFSVSIVAPGRQLFTYEAKSMRVPGVSGSIGIIAGRGALLASLQVGLVHILGIRERKHLLGLSGGFFEVIDNRAIVVADEIIFESEVKHPGVWIDRPLYIPNKFRDRLHKMEFLNAMLWRHLHP